MRFVLGAIALYFGLCPIFVFAGSDGLGRLSRHPYLQKATPDSIMILWRTTGKTVPIVKYGPAVDQLTNELPRGQIKVKLGPALLGPELLGPELIPRLHSAPPLTFQYEATISGLRSGSTYFYGIYDEEKVLAGEDSEHRFTTLPEVGKDASVRLWVAGDTGEGSLSQIQGFRAMLDFTANEGRAVNGFIHLGDMAYESGLDQEFSANFFDIYTEILRNTVIWPTMGNHEGETSSGTTQTGPYYDAYAPPTKGEAGGTASGTEAYYSFDIGRAHFICLDSHDLDRSSTGAMALWLNADLEKVEADWLIAFWHHPPYTKGSHDSDREFQLVEMRELIMPILESGGVDLVLSGHSHIYERSMLIDRAYATPTTSDGVVLDDGDGNPDGDGPYRKSAALNPHEGTIAIVAGHGEGAGSSFGPSPIMRATVADVGSLILDIDRDVLTGTMIDRDAAVRDRFQLVKQGLVTPELIEFPWQPVGPRYLVERFEPGATQVEMFPVPAAPDAVMHYTSDGSVPTVSSPIYKAPVAVADEGFLRGVTVWESGQKIGPVADSLPLSSGFSIHRYPATALDDGYEDSGGNVFLNKDTLKIGNGGVTGLRFTDVRIPPGSHIVEAKIQFHKAGMEAERMSTVGFIQGESHQNSPAFRSGRHDFSSRPKTKAVVAWIVRTWPSFSPRDLNTTTPKLGDIIRELINKKEWESGNAMSFFFAHVGEGRTAAAFESGKQRAATLSVVFFDVDGIIDSLASQSPVIEQIPGNLISMSMRWPAVAIGQKLGLTFQLEVSRDLESWRRIQPAGQSLSNPGADGFGELILEIDPLFLEVSERYYFRVRIVHQGKMDP